MAAFSLRLAVSLCGLSFMLTVDTAAPSLQPYAAFSENTRQQYAALHLNSRLQQEVSELSPSIADAALAKLARAGPEISIENNNAVGIDRGGNIYITELPVNRTGPARRRRRRGLDNAGDMTPERLTANGLPIKHSRPSSDNVIYLDFDGHEQVNLGDGGWPTFSATAFDLDGDNAMFSTEEQARTRLHVHPLVAWVQALTPKYRRRGSWRYGCGWRKITAYLTLM